MEKKNQNKPIEKPVEVPIIFHVREEVRGLPWVAKKTLTERAGSFLSQNFHIEYEQAEDMVRQAIVDGRIEVAARYPEIAETLVLLYNEAVNTPPDIRGMCCFTRVIFSP